jgi:hypothetical protein
MSLDSEKQNKARKNILKVYSDFVKKNKRNPTHAELQGLGVSRNALRWHFGTYRDLKQEARKLNPKAFEHIIDETLFNPFNFSVLEDEVAKYKKFIITTAVTGCEVHRGFYKAIKNYCKVNKALLLVIPVSDAAADAGWDLDKILKDEKLVFDNLELNSNIYISGIKMGAKQIDPTTGLGRMAQDSSFIYGSPKQRLKVVANSNHKLPHVLMGTGAITKPNYLTETYSSKRTAVLAEFDHKIGAIVLELEDEKYYFRQIQAEPNSGNFVDLARYYTSSGKISRLEPEAFILGDWHSGETDPVAAKVWEEVISETNPKDLILHDLFNGSSISHWTQNKVIKKARMALSGDTNLTKELKTTSVDLLNLLDLIKGKIIITKSNHDDFLARYLEDGRFMKDHENFKIAIEIVKEMVDDKDPVKFGVEMFLNEETKKRLKWLERDEDYRITKIECGTHGDKGPNGSKGTLENHERSYKACTIGHSHTPGILREAYQVGTTSRLDLDYAEGPSSWMHTSCLVYPNGSRQLINSIMGKWRLK